MKASVESRSHRDKYDVQKENRTGWTSTEYRCRFTAEGLSLVKGFYSQEKTLPKRADSGIRHVLAAAAHEDHDIRHVDVEQAHPNSRRVPVKPRAVAKLKKVIYRLGQPGRCWNLQIAVKLRSISYGQSKVDP